MHIPSKRLNDTKIPSIIQIIPFEINPRNEKSLVASTYNAPSQKKKFFSEKFIILGDFKMEVKYKVMKSFLQEHTFYNIMEQNTSFKGDEVSYINLLITNSKFSFMKANSFETGLSNHHHMIYTILKANLESLNQRNQCTAI